MIKPRDENVSRLPMTSHKSIFVGFVILLVSSLLGPSFALEDSLTYSMTIRDFLPAACVEASTYYSAWNVTPDGAFGGIKDGSFAYSSVSEVDTSGFHGYWASSSSSLDTFCPYWESLRTGEISGHPDFEMYGWFIHAENGPSCVRGEGCTANIDATVLNQTAIALSGLPKVQYCNSTRCGRHPKGLYTTTNRTYFHSWYNDDSKYNRRVGRKIQLNYNPGSGQDYYVFDSESSDADDITNDQTPYFTPLKEFVDLSQYQYTVQETPAWPHSDYGFTGTPYYRMSKMWFTTEIHTYFEYRGGEYFEFRGDDDVWVFINGELVVDLGGMHSSLTASVHLDNIAELAQLEINKTYAFDLFHAERRTDASNFRMTTTLASTCNVVKSGTSSFSWDSQNVETDWFLGPGVSWTSEGSMEPVLNLIHNKSVPFSPTFAYLSKRQNVGAGFVIEFDVQLSKVGNTEGFALVLHARDEGLINMPVSVGAGLGYRFLTNAVAVVFDLCADRNSSDTCSEQSVAIHYPNSNDEPIDANFDSRRVYEGIMRTMRRDDETHNIRIEYLATPDWLQVYINDSLYLRQHNFTIHDILGYRNAYVGFTSAVTDDPSRLQIKNLSISTVSVDSSATDAVDFLDGAEVDPIVIPADGETMGGLTVQYRDWCNYSITYGGDEDLINGIFIERLEATPSANETIASSMTQTNLRRGLVTDNITSAYYNKSSTPAIVNATIVDNGDGTYTAALFTNILGTFDLYICTGQSCYFEVEFEVLSSNLEGSDTLYTASASPQKHEWSASASRAVRVIPVTPRPTMMPSDSGEGSRNFYSEKYFYVSVGGGGAFALLSVSLFLLLRYRRKWYNNKAYVEHGKLYMLDREVRYDPNSEYNTVTNMVMQSSAEILRERARLTDDNNLDTISVLAQEKLELQDQLRNEKKKKQLNSTTRGNIFTPLTNFQRKGRKEFTGDEAPN